MGNIDKGIQEKYNDKILIWKRFIDDIFHIWTGDTQQLQDFLTHINSIHPTVSSHLFNSHIVNSHFVNFTLSIVTLSTSHFVNSHFVNIDQMGIDQIGIDKVRS